MLRQPVISSVVRLAGNVTTAGFAIVIVLQLLLAAGVLPVTMAWGGTQTVLTPQLRLAHLAAAVLLALFAYGMRRRAALIGTGPVSGPLKVFAWFITVYLALNTLGNFASASRGEALLFGPLTLLLTTTSAVVASSRA